MKNTLQQFKLTMKKILIFTGLLLLMVRVMAQDAITLHIGDPAPAIKYSKWLKGAPVNSFTGDRLYVLEFWATWCGPCIAAMPHLSELSKKYEAQAMFIGVDVLEKTVTRFVNSSGDRMSYNVIADNNAQDMANLWLKPAGIQGIPTTVVVRKGKIVWIGHPIDLDKVIDPILADTFDVAANKKNWEQRSGSLTRLATDITTARKAVQDAVDAKDFNKAFQMIETGIKNVPIMEVSLKSEKFKILLNNFTETEALNYATELEKENKAYISSIAYVIIEKDGLSKVAYQLAVDNFKKMTPVRSAILDKLALAQSKAGNVKEAIETEEKAVALAKIEVKDPKFGGRVFDYTIVEFEEKVKKYKSTLTN